MYRILSIVHIALIGLSALSFSQATGGKSVIATAGNSAITESEFLQRFELLPRPLSGGQYGLLKAKEELLLSMIAEKFLAEEAMKNDLEKNPRVVKEMDRVRRLLARNELYRDEVQSRVSVDPSEVSASIPYAKKNLLVQYIHAYDLADLKRILVDLDSLGTTWEASVEQHTSVTIDTVTIAWGEAEPQLEEAVYALGPGDVTKPIQSRFGWFLARVIASFENQAAEKLGVMELRAKIENVLRLRKEERRLNEYTRSVLSSADGRANPYPFRILTEALRTVAESEPDIAGSALSQESWDNVRDHIGGALDDTLLVMDHQYMSVGQVLDRIYASGMPIGNVSYPQLELHLNRLFKVWTWQSILEDVAMKKGLDSRPDVQNQIYMWHDHYLSEALRRKLTSEATVTTLDILRMLRHDGLLTDPIPIDVEIVWSREPSHVISYITSYAESSEIDPLTAGVQRRRVQDDVLSFGELGDSLWSRMEGAWATPYATDSGTVTGRILTWHMPGEMKRMNVDSLAVLVKSMKGRRAAGIAIARSAVRDGLRIYWNRIERVQVSETPMMTYRILGFGGRMFAVPFVRSSTDWYELFQEMREVLP